MLLNQRRVLSVCGSLVVFGMLPSCSSGKDSDEGNGAYAGSGASAGSVVINRGGATGQGGAYGAAGDSAGLLKGVDGRGASSSSSVSPVLPGDECAGEAFEGETLPLEIAIMMDRSVS